MLFSSLLWKMILQTIPRKLESLVFYKVSCRKIKL
jgi:hypothetical protein